jgi:hypothetical protein
VHAVVKPTVFNLIRFESTACLATKGLNHPNQETEGYSSRG